jgi:hypothetical protein
LTPIWIVEFSFHISRLRSTNSHWWCTVGPSVHIYSWRKHCNWPLQIMSPSRVVSTLSKLLLQVGTPLLASEEQGSIEIIHSVDMAKSRIDSCWHFLAQSPSEEVLSPSLGMVQEMHGWHFLAPLLRLS